MNCIQMFINKIKEFLKNLLLPFRVPNFGLVFLFYFAITFLRLLIFPIIVISWLHYLFAKYTKLEHFFYPIKIFTVITTGGTGGHIFPAIRLGSYFQQKGKNVCFYTNEISRHFFERKGYVSKKYYRESFYYTEDSLESPGAMLFFATNKIIPFRKNFNSVKNFCIGMLQGFWFFCTRGGLVKNVVGFGGYASFPMLFWGMVFFKKIYLHEQNTKLGKVNNLFFHFCEKCFIAFNSMRGKKIIYSGMPLTQFSEKRRFIKRVIEDKTNILVISGSNGGGEAAKIVVPAIINFAKERYVKVYHQASGSEADEIKKIYRKNRIPCEVLPFFENIYEILPSINIAISRSGASSIVDLLSFGVPTIFMPLQFSSQNHQVANALWIMQNHAGFICKYWETNIYSLVGLMNITIGGTKNLSRNGQVIIRRNARSVIYTTIFPFDILHHNKKVKKIIF